MFKLIPATVLPGFLVGPSKDQPGFAVAEEGSRRGAMTPGFNVPVPSDVFPGDGAQAGTGVGDVQPAASADDPQGLKMANAAAREAGLDTPELRQKFHRAITGQGITSYQELLNIARQIKAGTY
ncbi:MAG: hypothetical protein ACXU9B_10800 [Reyranella sp.]